MSDSTNGGGKQVLTDAELVCLCDLLKLHVSEGSVRDVIA